MDAGVTQGPMINGDSVAKVEEHIADAVALGAKIVTGGKRHALGGNFFEPTVLVDVVKGMKILKEETFGPVAPIIAFDTEDEVIEMANDTEFGLASYFYARDLSRVWRVAEAVEVTAGEPAAMGKMRKREKRRAGRAIGPRGPAQPFLPNCGSIFSRRASNNPGSVERITHTKKWR